MSTSKRRKPQKLDSRRGVFMISVAAELADMHPQTLRMYEARGLVTPQRSPGKTRLYSQRDVERLRRIQRMTDEGLNLAGVETVLEMELQLERLRDELKRMRRRADDAEKRMLEELEQMRTSLRLELVPYGAYEPGEPLGGNAGPRTVDIPVERGRGSKAAEDGGMS
jgi:MerR family transcriptional regulator, heat shock protein HspR